MAELLPYPRFSMAERDRRWAAVRKLMREEGIDVIVVPNNSGHSTDFQSNARYLSHVGGGNDADVSVVFPLNGEVTAIATSAHARWPCVQDWTTDIREADRRYGAVAGERLKELKADRGKIGIAGLGGGTRTPEGTMSHGFWRQIHEVAPNATFVDATQILRNVRMVKSDEEVAALRKSTEIVEKGVKAKIAKARPGVVDWEVWAAAISAMLSAGSELSIHYNWISGKNPIRTLTRPTMRPLERGDLIIDELEASWIGYRSQIFQPVFVEVANPNHVELIKVQRDVFNAVLERFRPGVTIRELVETTLRACEKARPSSGPAAGCVGRLTMHGRGQGDDAPIAVRDPTKSPDLDVPLQANMVCILKPDVQTKINGEHYLCCWGDTVVVTERGGVRLGTLPHDLAIAGA